MTSLVGLLGGKVCHVIKVAADSFSADRYHEHSGIAGWQSFTDSEATVILGSITSEDVSRTFGNFFFFFFFFKDV